LLAVCRTDATLGEPGTTGGRFTWGSRGSAPILLAELPAALRGHIGLYSASAQSGK
jgi:hypothetical protein